MRHAYMIMAHNQEALLKILIKKLDSDSNDIILHIDAKSAINADTLLNVPNYAKIYLADAVNVTWGAYSQIQAELNLMKKATAIGHHAFYHLLTGADLPIKPIEEITNFYNANVGREFINFSGLTECHRQYKLRIKYSHYFRELCGRKKNLFTLLNKLFILIQKVIHKQSKLSLSDFYFGSAYWDISEELVNYILSKEQYIFSIYRYSTCCDEAFVQSLVWNNEYFRNRLYINGLDNGRISNMRWIDMAHGVNAGAYIIRESDIEDIKNSGLLFARKFDYDKYPETVEQFAN